MLPPKRHRHVIDPVVCSSAPPVSIDRHWRRPLVMLGVVDAPLAGGGLVWQRRGGVHVVIHQARKNLLQSQKTACLAVLRSQKIKARLKKIRLNFNFETQSRYLV